MSMPIHAASCCMLITTGLELLKNASQRGLRNCSLDDILCAQLGLPMGTRLANTKEGCFMKTMMMALMLLCLSFGCITSESRPSPPETAAEDVEQVEQAIGSSCAVDCDCPLTERCNFSTGTCTGYAVFGPDTSPLKCVNNCQCGKYYNSLSACNMDSGSYGHCVLALPI